MVSRSASNGKRRRLPGLDVRPGSLRQARTEAGLSLAQVAAGEISRTAVFLAETGKTRPTMPTVVLIASRTGKPLDYFLDPAAMAGMPDASGRPDLDKLRELAAAENAEALREASEAAVAEAKDPADKAWAGFYHAQALIRLANPRLALDELRDVRRAFQAAGDQWMVVECMDWESAGLHLLEDRTAFDMASSALAACRQLEPQNRALEARILGRLASIHVANHDWTKAIEHYSQAVDVAGEIKDLSRLGKMYSDLSIAYERLGDLARARVFSQKAVTIHELLQDQLSVARAENNLGMVLIRQGELEQAREHLNRSLRICDETGVELGKGHVLLSLAELDLSGGDPEGARRHLEQAREISERGNEKASLAMTHQLLGRVAEMKGMAARADQEFSTAISILEQAGLAERLVSCFTMYARLLEDRGDILGALEQMKRAVTVTRPDLSAVTGEAAEETA